MKAIISDAIQHPSALFTGKIRMARDHPAPPEAFTQAELRIHAAAQPGHTGPRHGLCFGLTF